MWDMMMVDMNLSKEVGNGARDEQWQRRGKDAEAMGGTWVKPLVRAFFNMTFLVLSLGLDTHFPLDAYSEDPSSGS
jgi:hypothetical protein